MGRLGCECLEDVEEALHVCLDQAAAAAQLQSAKAMEE